MQRSPLSLPAEIIASRKRWRYSLTLLHVTVNTDFERIVCGVN